MQEEINGNGYDEDAALQQALKASLETVEEQKPQETLNPIMGLVEYYQEKVNKVVLAANQESKGRKDLPSHLFASETDFWYYNCMDEMDRGWGCTYRVMQMVFSNLQKRGFLDNIKMPSLREIQQRLATLPGYNSSIVGSKKWLEPPDANNYFKSYKLGGYDTTYDFAKERHVNKFWEDLKCHFSTVRTPVIVDDKFSTYGVLGVASNEGNRKVLVFDPHMHVKKTMTIEDFEEQSAKKKGGWRTIELHFKQKLWMVYYPLGSASTKEDHAAQRRSRHDSSDCNCCILI